MSTLTDNLAQKPQNPQDRLAELKGQYGMLSGFDLLSALYKDQKCGPIALVSSFGTESAVLLHMLSQIDTAAPVLLINTGKLFGETIRYKQTLCHTLGLTNVQDIKPDPIALKTADPKNLLFTKDPDRCCDVRKTQPMEQALANFDMWITGRKRFQTQDRKMLKVLEATETHIKVNPLANWTPQHISDYYQQNKLPQHPLYAEGYLSIGCYTCTDRVEDGEDARAGRWRGLVKTECGIHLKSPTYDPVL